jgi:hypothetical protein
MLRCNKNQDYLMFKCILIDSMKSLIDVSYFQPKNNPKIVPKRNQIITAYQETQQLLL